MTKIHLLTLTPSELLVVFYEQLWQLRVLSSDGAIYGHSKSYYSVDAAEKAGRGWVGSG